MGSAVPDADLSRRPDRAEGVPRHPRRPPCRRSCRGQGLVPPTTASVILQALQNGRFGQGLHPSTPPHLQTREIGSSKDAPLSREPTARPPDRPTDPSHGPIRRTSLSISMSVGPENRSPPLNLSPPLSANPTPPPTRCTPSRARRLEEALERDDVVAQHGDRHRDDHANAAAEKLSEAVERGGSDARGPGGSVPSRGAGSTGGADASASGRDGKPADRGVLRGAQTTRLSVRAPVPGKASKRPRLPPRRESGQLGGRRLCTTPSAWRRPRLDPAGQGVPTSVPRRHETMTHDPGFRKHAKPSGRSLATAPKPLVLRLEDAGRRRL